MNIRLVARLLGLICMLTGGSMLFSLPWAFGYGSDESQGIILHASESQGFWALLGSFALAITVGILLRYWGQSGRGATLYRKEAMAVVGLSWVLATLLGGLPFLFSGVCMRAGDDGIGLLDGVNAFADAMFESQSGFSTTGATVLTELDDPLVNPRCILFWRSSTHFLGGLGIIVLFVAILGQGSAGKALMRAEMPGPSKDTGHARMQHAALRFAGIYVLLNAVLTLLLWLEGMSLFDALCHAFGTLATGGFSTHDASLGHFQSATIEFTVLVFMVLAGCNFSLLYLLAVRQVHKVWADVEFRTYMAVLIGITALVVLFGLYNADSQTGNTDFTSWGDALRYGSFQVVSIMTTTGFGTHDFDNWNTFSRGVLFLLMFVGGCAGSTGGGLKVIRHVLFLKVIWMEFEQVFHPRVVRPLRLGGNPVDDPELAHKILVYFGTVLVIFIFSWMILMTVEPDSTWTDNGDPVENKLIDCASAVSATLNNIGPGLGTIGATRNYAHFSWYSKLMFVWLMMAGRLEFFVIIVLLVPAFWRSQ